MALGGDGRGGGGVGGGACFSRFSRCGGLFFSREARIPKAQRATQRKTGVLRAQNPGFCAARAAIGRLCYEYERGLNSHTDVATRPRPSLAL